MPAPTPSANIPPSTPGTGGPRGTGGSPVLPRQSSFLRALIKHPHGLPADLWPSPLLLRRWLRSPDFRRALASIRQALYAHSQLQLAYTSYDAARQLQGFVAARTSTTAPPPAGPDSRPQLTHRADPLRIAADLLKHASKDQPDPFDDDAGY